MSFEIVYSPYERRKIQELVERAEVGAAILDRVSPGWEMNISPEKIDMSDTERCILGQLYGSFKEGLKQIGDECHDLAAAGFMLHGGSFHDRTYLGEAWKQVLEDHRNARFQNLLATRERQQRSPQNRTPVKVND